MSSATGASLSHRSVLLFQKSSADTGFPLREFTSWTSVRYWFSCCIPASVAEGGCCACWLAILTARNLKHLSDCGNCAVWSLAELLSESKSKIAIFHFTFIWLPQKSIDFTFTSWNLLTFTLAFTWSSTILLIMSPLGDIYAFASWQNRQFGGVFRP